ncbi:HD domain-containing protein [Endozoicomonas sp. SM1973]|uniref:HD domain-containing protein n=1 Tax=Spartinivicinus marinus TaxID=2994442 RepID=A0A853I7Q6_9GAMM|nr:HD domain-containing protein [Spartinivicinus marinus]MCX4025881.1 HD domain-containing protein [Spartinivicinus marinus]NYZ68849.1 HD domain-containing protein [Spartinivicinus marinus]
MKTVSFTCLNDSTREEFEYLDSLEERFRAGLPDRIIEALKRLEFTLGGYPINRLEHSLQSATRALNNGESEEMIMAALVHDIGDDLAPWSHSEMAAAILRPFVSDKTYWIIKHHGVFQLHYYAHHCGGNPNARDAFRGSPWFEDCVHFCEEYDQNCFDPNYNWRSLSFFEPMIHRFFTNPKTADHEYTARYGS